MRLYFKFFRYVATDNDPEAPKTYTEEEVKKLVETETGKVKVERAATVKQLEDLKKAQGLSAKEKGDLQARIDELQNLNLSKEEQARLQGERLQTEYQQKEETLKGEVSHWQSQYAGYRIENEIFRSASEGKAYSPQQMVDFLRPKTKLIERKEQVEGKEIVRYEPIVQFADRDKDGKPVELMLTIGDAIKRMKELPEQFGNLFKSEANGGTGLMNGGPGPGTAGFRTDMSAEEYAKFRKTQSFGSKIK